MLFADQTNGLRGLMMSPTREVKEHGGEGKRSYLSHGPQGGEVLPDSLAARAPDSLSPAPHLSSACHAG